MKKYCFAIVFLFLFLGNTVTAKAQLIYDIPCPAGTSILGGWAQTYNQVDNHYKAYLCVDSLGNVTGPQFGVSPNLQINTISRNCNNAPNCLQIFGDTLHDVDASWTNGSNVITTSSAVPAFSPTNVIGKNGWATGNCVPASENACNYNCRYGALTFISAHQVSLPLNCNANSSATAHANNFIWCTDDGPAVQTFFANVFFPLGLNPQQPQALNLPAGPFCSSVPPFVDSSAPGFVKWPETINGQNTQIYIPPVVSCSPYCALNDYYSQDTLGNLGMASYFSNFTIYCGGNDLHDASGTQTNPSYYISTNLLDNFWNVWVQGCDWNVLNTTPVYGFNCVGGSIHGGGSFAGGNFGALAHDFVAPCNLFGGNYGGSENNGIVVTGRVNAFGVYTNQSRLANFANKLSYGVYINTAAAIFNDYGSYINIWSDSGTSMFHGSHMTGFSSIFDFNLAGGTIVLDAVDTKENCNMSGGSLFDAAYNNGAPGKICPTGFTNTGGSIFGDASITGTVAVSGNWALSAGWGTGPTVTAVSGNSKRTRYTVTVGTTPAANPTITHTFATAFLTGTVPVCSIKQDGGTQAAVANPFTVGTPTATSVVYTYTATPTAGLTLILEEDCSNP